MPYSRTDLAMNQTIKEPVIDGIYCYCLCQSPTGLEGSSLRIVDVSNPAAPVVVGTVYTAYPGVAPAGYEISARLVVRGNYLYICNYLEAGQNSTSIIVIDITNKTAPVKVGNVPASLPSTDISGLNGPQFIPMALNGNYLYVQGQNPQGLTTDVVYLRALNIATPTAPTIASNFTLSVWPNFFYAGRMVMVGGYLYSSIWDNQGNPAINSNPFSGLYVYDVSSPTVLNKIAQIDLRVVPTSAPLNTPVYFDFELVYSGNYIYACNSNRIMVVDVSTPTAPVLVNTILFGADIATSPRYVAKQGNKLFIINYDGQRYVSFVRTKVEHISVTRIDVANPLAAIIEETVIIDVGAIVATNNNISFGLAAANNAIYITWQDLVSNLGWLTILYNFTADATGSLGNGGTANVRQIFVNT